MIGLNRKVLVIAVALMAVAMLALTMSAAYATKPTPVTAYRRRIGPMTDESWMAGNSDNRFTHRITRHEWTGDIVGISDADAMRFHRNWPDGPVRVRVVDTFSSATVMGKTGGLTIRLEFVIEEGFHEGTWVIIGGTGELANLHGQGTLSGPSGDVVYSGMVHFDP